MAFLKYRLFSSSLTRSSGSSRIRSSTARDVAVMTGARYWRTNTAGSAVQPLHDLLAPGRVAAGGPAQGFAQGAGDDVHPAHDAAMFVGAAPILAHEAHGVGIVDHDQGVVPVGQVADGLQVGDAAVHGEDAVGDDEPVAAIRGIFQLRFQIGHVVIGIAEPFGLAQPHPVDDGGMVQGVADDRVLGAEQGFEEAAVGVEAGAVQDGVLGSQKFGQAALKLLVHVLGAADETHGGQAVAVAVQGLVRGFDEALVAGQAKIVVGAEVEHLAAARP
jgi:hypothetical protein